MMTLLSVMEVMPVVPWGRGAADPSLPDSPKGARCREYRQIPVTSVGNQWLPWWLRW